MHLADCEAIYRAAWETNDQAKFKEYCEELLHEYRVFVIGAKRGSVGFWRTRLVENEKPWPNVSDMYAPPADKAFNRRFSNKGSPCFYASNDYRTTIHEIEANVGDVVQCASFQLGYFDQIILITIGEFANVCTRGFMMLNGVGMPAYEAMGIGQMGLVKRTQIVSIDKFFAHVLADVNARNEDYMRTRTLTELLYREQPGAHGITYPSVRDPHGLNFAILPEIARERFQNVACEVHRVTGKYSYCMNDLEPMLSCVALSDTGDFTWAPKIADKISQYNLTMEELAKGHAEGRLTWRVAGSA